MAENIDLKITVKAWADIVVENWREKLKQMGVYDTWTLYNSFDKWGTEIPVNSQGNPKSVTFNFMVYGRFVDMGVGRGVKIGDVKMLNAERRAGNTHISANRRKPRKWYSAEFYRQRQQLERLMEEKYGVKAKTALIEALDDNTMYGNSNKF